MRTNRFFDEAENACRGIGPAAHTMIADLGRLSRAGRAAGSGGLRLRLQSALRAGVETSMCSLNRSRPSTDQHKRSKRSRCRSLITRHVVHLTLIVIVGLSAMGIAFAQETPVLVAKGLPKIDGWCGEHSVYFNIDNGTLGDLVTLDVLSGKETKLQFGRSTVLLGCSPDGRWVLTQSAVGDFRRSDGEGSEGGGGDCGIYADGDLDRIVLWDMKAGTHQVVGKGYLDFEWSPDGRLLLYNFRPVCNLEENPANAFKLPAAISEFQPISVRAMIVKLLGPNSGWSDSGRIGAVNWYAPDAFVAQLPENEGNLLGNNTPAGAIVAVHQIAGGVPRIEQLNPSRFQSTWKLAVEQIETVASDEILRSANCFVVAVPRRPTSMGCDRHDKIGFVGFRPDLATYCPTLNSGDIGPFCAPDPLKSTWWRMVRGSIVLLVKPSSTTISGNYLFRMEHDREGYLK
jgi:hypothetical protein